MDYLYAHAPCGAIKNIRKLEHCITALQAAWLGKNV